MAKDVQTYNASKQVYRSYDNRICFQINGNEKTRLELAPLVVNVDQVGVLNLLDSPNTNGGGRRFSLPNTANANGQATSRQWQSYSSIRYKENVEPLINATSTVTRLNPVRYQWKREYGGNVDFGFIAEEIANVLPNAVVTNQDGTYEGIDYSKIIPYLTSVIQENQQRIENLKKRVEAIQDV